MPKKTGYPMDSGFERNSLYLIGSQLFILIASLLSQVILTRNLLTSEYGIIVIIIDIGMTLSLLIDFGMPTWLGREWDGSKNSVSGLIGRVLAAETKILIFLSVITLTILHLMGEIFSFALIILSCFVLMIAEPLRLGLRLVDKTQFEAISRSLERILIVSCYFWLESIGKLDIPNIGKVLFFCSIVTLLITAFFYKRSVLSRFEYRKIEIGFFEILKFSIPFSLALAIYPLIGRTDKLVLAYFSGTESVGIYNIGWIVISVGLMVTSKLRQAILPSLAEGKSLNQKIEAIMKARPLINSLVIIGIPCCLIASYVLLEIVFPPEYLQYENNRQIGGFNLILMMLPLWVWSMFSVGVLEATKFHDNKWAFLSSLGIGLFANVSICFVLIPSLGIVGAVLGSILSQFAIYISVCLMNEFNRMEAKSFIFELVAGIMVTSSCIILALTNSLNFNLTWNLLIGVTGISGGLLLISIDIYISLKSKNRESFT